MRATKPIKAGEQIFNTYGNPPNSDLLRRYSHVDEPNGNDIVELTASNLVQGAVNCLLSSTNQDERELKSQALKTILSERLEWACEFSLLDDTFILTYPFPPSIQEPYLTGSETEGKLSNKDFRRACKIDSEKEKGNLSSELIIASRFLLMSKESFKKFQKKQSLPKAEIDSIESVDEKERDISIAELICEAIKDRSKKYETELEFDEERLYGNERLMVKDEKDEKVRKALVVRVGEKRILRDNCLLFGFVKREVDKEIEKREKKKSGSKKRGGGKEEGGGKRRKA